MECCESSVTSKKMVASLQSRRDALEMRLREKTQELKKLCIQEAELTGILPPETPIEPGESPPIFRRKIGTAFAYPENLIDKLKSKEEEALARLELECKIQTSIAEAALGLANDGNASKSIRRKHRLEYQRSQRRLAELEMRLSVLRQSIKSSSGQFQRKKPRPPLNNVLLADAVDGGSVIVDGLPLPPAPPPLDLGSDELDSHFQHMHADEPSSLSFVNRDIIRNSHFYNSFGKSTHNYPSYVHHLHHQPAHHLAPQQQQQHYNHQRPTHHHHLPVSKSNSWNRNQLYRRSIGRTHHNSTSSSYDDDPNANWLEDTSLWRNTAPVGYFSNQCYTTLPGDVSAGCGGSRMKTRYGSLDRRHRTMSSHSSSGVGGNGGECTADYLPQSILSSRVSPTLSISCQQQGTGSPAANSSRRNSQNCAPSPTGSSNTVISVVLLPNQTYPENSLMRTQSLGNVEHPPRKSLDTHSLQEKPLLDNFPCSTLGRRTREKEWRETSLDADGYNQQRVELLQQPQQQQEHLQPQQQQQRRCETPPLHPRASKTSSLLVAESPLPQRPFSRRNAQTPPPPLPPPHNSVIAPSPPPITSKSPVKSPSLIESAAVPLESPKNHTVVEVGKWQPYREVTKPFEMSDFYKYSTKFRKSNE